MSGIFEPAPLPTQRREVLFQSPGISVIDFRCRARVEPEGPEEPNPSHSIALFRRGVLRYTHKSTVVLADANHILFANEAQPYRYAHPVAGGDDSTVLRLGTERARELVAHHAPRDAERPDGPFPFAYGITSARTSRLHYELLRLLRSAALPLAVEDLLTELADEAVKDACIVHDRESKAAVFTPASSRRRRDLVEAAKLELNRRLGAVPSLGALAATLGCSPFHLSRTFHRAAGLSLRRYVGRLRTGIAAHALVRGARDLSELALELGYADHSHFTNAFRREWGLPPSRFRARNRSQREGRDRSGGAKPRDP